MGYELVPYPPITVSGDRSASSHKAWLDDHVKEGMDLLQWIQARTSGDATEAAFDYGATGRGSLQCVAAGTPNMTVVVQAGAGRLDDSLFRKTADETTGAFVAPVTNPRIDTIGINAADGSVVVYAGTEAASPSAPAVAAGVFKIAEIYHRVGETSITDADDSTNGYITDTRTVHQWRNVAVPNYAGSASPLLLSDGGSYASWSEAFNADPDTGDLGIDGDLAAVDATLSGTLTVAGISSFGGNVTLTRVGAAAAANLTLKGDAGQYRQMVLSTGNAARWAIRASNSAEGGSNAGSNLHVAAFSDAGSALVDAITITRATGAVALADDLDVDGDLTVGTMLTVVLGGATGDVDADGTITGGNLSTAGTATLATISAGLLSVSSLVTFSGLPTSDPSVAGQIWSDGGTLKVSAG